MQTEESVGNVHVLCRFRPLNEKELRSSNNISVRFMDDFQTVVLANNENLGPQRYTFDRVFSPEASQDEVYEHAASPIVEAIMQGFNGTILAYGQTSSGKTHTMMGSDIEDMNNRGVIPRMVNSVFEQINDSSEAIEFTVKVGYCEIYMEKIKDLLDPVKINLKIKEDRTKGVYIDDLMEDYVSNEEEVFELMKLGNINREVAATNMNQGSSRSHSIFMITVTQSNTKDHSSKVSKLYLVDLAGSEKVSKTGAEGKRLDEAKNINKSLTTLGMVIYALTDGKSTHIPYRDSKLTRVLQDSIGGNSKTCLIITCSPSPLNENETVSTLRFGVRAKNIKNKPKINREYTVAELKMMLARATEQIGHRDKRISDLEKTLKSLGVAIPDAISAEEKEELEEIKRKSEAYSQILADLEIMTEKLQEEQNKNMLLEERVNEQLNVIQQIAIENEQMKKGVDPLQARIVFLEKELEIKDEIIDSLSVLKITVAGNQQAFEEQRFELEQKLNEKSIECSQLLNSAKEIEAKYKHTLAEMQQKLSENSNLLERACKISGIDLETLRANISSEVILIEKEPNTPSRLTVSTSLTPELTRSTSLIESPLDEKSWRAKYESLQKSHEQLTVLYHKTCSQKSMLTVDKQVSERKIFQLKDKLQKLEQQLKDCSDKLKSSEIRVAALTQEVFELNNQSKLMPAAISRIKKPIKGGAGFMTGKSLSSRMFLTYSIPIDINRDIEGPEYQPLP
jgi:kinesin family protein 5